MVKKTSHRKRAAHKGRVASVWDRQLVGPDVLVDFFRWAGVPDDEIPALIEQCEPGSTSRRWTEVLAGWQQARGIVCLPEHLPEDDPLPTRKEIRNHATQCTQLIAGADDHDGLALCVGRATVKHCLASIRAMGEPAPAAPWPAQTLEEVRRGLDTVILWCEPAEAQGPLTEPLGCAELGRLFICHRN